MPNCPTGLAGLLCNAFVPSTDLSTRVDGLAQMLETKFPFNVVTQLQSFSQTVGAGSHYTWSFGQIQVATVEFAPLFSIIKPVATVAIFAYLLYYVIDTLIPQFTIKA